MICPNCHATIPDNAEICPNCNHIIVRYDNDDSFDTIEIPLDSLNVDSTNEVSASKQSYAEYADTETAANDNSNPNKTVASAESKSKSKKSFFPFGKQKQHNKDDQKNSGPSRRNQKQGQNYFTAYLSYLVSYLKNPMQLPKYDDNSFNPNHGITSLLILSILNAISFTSLANYFVTHYEWFADLSVLPNLNFDFIAWRFGLKTFVFLIISLWLLPAITHFFNQNKGKVKVHNNAWLTHYYGINSINIVLSIICFLFSLLAPLIFITIVLLFILLQVSLIIISTAISLLQTSETNNHKTFYSIIAVFAIFFVLEVFLVGLIY